MQFKNLNVTKAPQYSREVDPQTGKHKVRISVEIDGTATSVEAYGSDSRSAYSSAMARFTTTVHGKYDQFDSKYQVMTVLGNPREAAPSQLALSASTASNKNDPKAIAPKFDSEGSEEDEEEKLVPGKPGETKDEPVKRPMIKGNPRNHLPFPNNNDGRDGKALEEPMPGQAMRPGEAVLTAKGINKSATDNNASIFFGRERGNDAGFNFGPNSEKRNLKSRYSDQMGAGCLDLVAGRMAPFPLDKVNDHGPLFAGPMFNTHRPTDLVNLQLSGGIHPGMCMDAARIYISQMTTLDYNFNLRGTERATDRATGKAELYPCSGIILKADKVRMHARQDIKIVTGGTWETVNSQGNRITQNNGIHLIAENGRNKDNKLIPQQPIVLGDNLVLAMTKLVDLISTLGGIVDNFAADQILFNQILANHYHILPEMLPTMPSIEGSLQGFLTTLGQIANTRIAVYMDDLNKGLYATKYLSPLGSNYINSRHNTVN
jgi:hypothetical protein